MRSTFSGLNTMVRGVFANQLSLDTVGHNITNASTEGYSRQKVNLAATRGQGVSSLYGNVMVGTGVDSMSIERARNIYADKQFWQETSTQEYYKTTQVNYEKIEAAEQRRICDFVNGVCYVLDGCAKRVTGQIVLYVPAGVDVAEAMTVAMPE